MHSLFRASPTTTAMNWPSVIARGFVISAILTLLYCRRIVWTSFASVEGGPIAKLISLVAYCWQDLVVLALLVGWALIFEAKRSHWLWSIITVLICLFVMTATVFNVYAMHIVGSPLDASWLGEVNLRDAGTAWPMITAYISPGMKQLSVISFVVMPFVGLAIAKFAVTRLTGALLLLVLGSMIAFGLQFVIGAAAFPVEKRLAFKNPVFGELRDLVWPPRTLALLNGEASAAVATGELSYAMQPVRPSTFNCCAGQNIVLITIDSVPQKTLEKALSPATRSNFPNLSELFDHGIAFRNFYANFPMSAQAMGTMVTSIHPSFSPVLTTMEEVYDKDIAILPSVLSSHGYKSAHFMGGQLKYAGAADLLKNRGLDTIEDSDSLKCGDDDAAAMAIYAHLGDDCTAAAVSRWIDDRGKEKFFLWVWFTNPHSPYFVRARARIGGTLGSFEQHMAALAETDAAIGVLRNKLKSKGLLDQTVFVIVGDHGEAFGEHGQLNHGTSVFEEQVHVPLLFSGGNVVASHREMDAIGSMVDLAPSILDVAGISAPAGWQGRSMFAKDRANEAFFASRRSGRMVGLRVGDIKYVLSSLEEGVVAYDLSKDPGEQAPLRLDADTEKDISGKISAYVAYRKAMKWPPRKSASGP
ncbi:sulfatase [Bradyrhizobium sp. SRL28]|uniref:sulfatase n=1 Tax=Bradyrhizobium sp. SRL28 TaxID=2836178 RepID=UPI001BDE378C|nr:sulfatase [Bradyrhizobium sp. SRL28]MBT1515981.1 sulfatase [Bradyrhizobium sp. SRL28]